MDHRAFQAFLDGKHSASQATHFIKSVAGNGKSLQAGLEGIYQAGVAMGKQIELNNIKKVRMHNAKYGLIAGGIALVIGAGLYVKAHWFTKRYFIGIKTKDSDQSILTFTEEFKNEKEAVEYANKIRKKISEPAFLVRIDLDEYNPDDLSVVIIESQ